MRKNNTSKLLASILLTGTMGITNISPVLAQTELMDDSSIEETQQGETIEETTGTEQPSDSASPSQVDAGSENGTENGAEESEEPVENEEVSVQADYSSLPGLQGNYESADEGLRILQTDGDNHLISSVQGKTFSFSSDVTFEGGENKTSFIFGAERNTSPSDIGKFFGLELSLNGNEVQIKLFQNPLDGTTLGDNIISPTTVTSVEDTTQPIHWTISVDDQNNLAVTVNGVTAQYTMNQPFASAYQGGYFGFLTFRSQVLYQNVSLNADPIPTANFNTNLTNLHGLSGTWNETENGLYSNGSGDNFAISDTVVKNFEYSANIKNEGKKGAGSLVFRSESNPGDGSLVMNIDYSGNVFKLFSFGSGGGTYETISLANVPEKDDGSYDLKAQMYDNHLRVYVNNVGIINRDIDFRPDEGRLGLLTWDGTIVYQNVVYQELTQWDDIETPHLTGITLPEGVTITPEFGEGVSIYGMDIQPEVDEATIGLEAPKGSKLYVTKSDENGNIIKEKTEVVDGQFTIFANEFYEDFMNVDVTIEAGGFSSIVNFAVNKWTSTEDLANEEYRSQFHITPQSNFMNDPNGLVYDSTDGYWHVYYQYSTKNNFNNQSWAHVRSKDLVNWEQMPLALQIDDNGLIFSGCAIEDTNNISGLFEEDDNFGYGSEKSRLIVYYTYNGPTGQTQAYAYSTDHGVTWTKGDVILDSSNAYDGDTANFRDPKVFQVPGDDEHYYMVTAGGAAQIFTSTNLIDWTFSQNLTYTDGTQIYSECPMMYEATIEGTDETKWIYGGSAGFYVVGDMEMDAESGIYKWTAESDKLNVESNEDPWNGFGKYATMTFWKDKEDANRVIGISWLQDTKDFDGKDYKGVQSLPQEYGLKLVNGEYVITCYPVEEVNALRDVENPLYESTEGTVITPDDGNILQGTSGIMYDLEAVFDLDDTTATEFGFKLRQGNGKEYVYKYDVEQQKMVLDVSNSDSCQSSGIWQQTLTPMEGNKIHLRIIIDQGAVESFGNYGEANISTVAYMSRSNVGMEFFTDGAITLDSLNIYEMKSMYSGETGSQTEEQQIYLNAPSYVETGNTFTVNANVYPNLSSDESVEWSYGDGLEVINEGKTYTTLRANTPGTYTITAKIGELEKEISVRIADPSFENNADGWESISGNWSVSDEGLNANNANAGDSFYLSDAVVTANQPFTITGNLKIESGQAAGIVFGVTDKENPTSNWFCANIDTISDGGIAKLFQNNGGEMWNVTKPLSEITPNEDGSYDLKIEYDGNGTMTYSVNGVLVGSNSNTNFSSGHVGVQTFRANAIFNNVQVSITGGTITDIIGSIDPITVQTGSSLEDLMASLPTETQVKMDNGTFATAQLTWDISNVDLATAGTYTIIGSVTGTSRQIEVQVTVKGTPTSVDASKLEELTSNIQNMDLSGYTQESADALKSKLEEALTLLEKDGVTQEEIDSMLNELQMVLDALKEEQQPTNPSVPDGSEDTGNENNGQNNTDPTQGNNPDTSTDHSKKTDGTHTGAAIGAGVFGSVAGLSVFGAAILSIFKRRKK